MWAVGSQDPLSMGFSRQEYWSGLPFPSPGDLLDPGIKPTSSLLQVDSLLLSPWGSPYISLFYIKNPGLWDFPGGLVVENLPANAGDAGRCGFNCQVGKIPEEKMATHSTILAWRIPWTEEPGRL